MDLVSNYARLISDTQFEVLPFQKYMYLLVFIGQSYFKQTFCHELSSRPSLQEWILQVVEE